MRMIVMMIGLTATGEHCTTHITRVMIKIAGMTSTIVALYVTIGPYNEDMYIGLPLANTVRSCIEDGYRTDCHC